MFKRVLYSYYNLGLLTSLTQRIHDLLAKQFPDHERLNALRMNLNESILWAIKAVGSTTRIASTPTIQKANKKRGDSFRSLRDHVKSGLRRQNEAYQKACKVLWPEFEKNGLLLYRLNDGNQSASILSLLEDLNTETNQTHLATINATEWVAELERDHASFTKMSTDRSKQRANDKTPTDKMAHARLKKSVKLALSTLETISELDNLPDLPATIAKVNVYISETNIEARRSRKRKK